MLTDPGMLPLLTALDISVCLLLMSSILCTGGLIATWLVLCGEVLLVAAI